MPRSTVRPPTRSRSKEGDLYIAHKKRVGEFGRFGRTNSLEATVPYVQAGDSRQATGGASVGLEVLAGLIAFGTINFIWAILSDTNDGEAH